MPPVVVVLRQTPCKQPSKLLWTKLRKQHTKLFLFFSLPKKNGKGSRRMASDGGISSSRRRRSSLQGGNRDVYTVTFKC